MTKLIKLGDGKYGVKERPDITIEKIYDPRGEKGLDRRRFILSDGANWLVRKNGKVIDRAIKLSSIRIRLEKCPNLYT